MPALELHADFDRDGRLTESPAEYTARETPPGAILVANFDVDRRRLSSSVTASSEPTLDYAQPTKGAGDDELLRLRIKIVNPGAVGGQLILRLPGIHAIRTRLYDDAGRILPSFPGVSSEKPIVLPAGPHLDFTVEARTAPGSPFGFATLFDTTFTPRLEDELRFELVLLKRDAAGLETVIDRGRLTNAPVIFLDNSALARRVYICDADDNAPSLEDVRTALRSIGGVELVTVPVDVAGGDTWLQDQFQPGVVVGADRWRHAIVHVPRMRANFALVGAAQNLEQFVRSHFPSRDVGVLNDFWARQIAFADADGRLVELAVRDAVSIGSRMDKVGHLARHLDRLMSKLDPDAEQHGALSWSSLRQGLPAFVEAVRSKVRAAGLADTEQWRAIVADAERRLSHVESELPMTGDGERFRFTVPRTSFELAAERADELYRRAGQFSSSGNYGGNIEVAPPTDAATLGTIVVGNQRIDGRFEHVDPDVLSFLYAQRKQPVVEVNTTWLDVGHVDEILTFVSDQATPVRFAALRASSGLGLRLVRAAARRHLDGLSEAARLGLPNRPSGVMPRLTDHGSAPVTRLLRGKAWVHSHPQPPRPGAMPDILEPPRIYQDLSLALNGGDPADPYSEGVNIHDIHYWPGEGPLRAYPADITVLELLFAERDDHGESVNDFLEEQFLEPLRQVVENAFDGARVLPLPVVFDTTDNIGEWRDNPWARSTSAFTPDVVNMQVVNGHLLVPRPNGPRMRPADALAVLDEVLRETPGTEDLRRRLTTRFLQRRSLTTTVCWIRRFPTIHRPIGASGIIRGVWDGIDDIDDVAGLFEDGFPGLTVAQVATRIRGANPAHFDPNGRLRDGWRRLVIPEGLVDIFEAWVELAAASLGVRVDWVDSWFYHVHFGEIHCGTNVLRVPDRRLPRWWDVPDAPLPAQVLEFEEEEQVEALTP
jgi:hypothetical protein